MHEKNEDKRSASITESSENNPAREVVYLPLAQKILSIRGLSPKEKLNRILSDAEAGRIVKAFEPQELYWLLKETGESDSLELLELCSPEQTMFFLDMECWEKYEFSTAKFMEWLGYLMEGGEEKISGLLSQLDREFLLLCLIRSISVTGGIGHEINNEELRTEWDHTYDDCYFIKFRDANHAPLIGKFLDIMYRNNHPLYLALMESLQSEISGEIEELSYRFRVGRLADLGFPSYEDAISIYAAMDPESYIPAAEEKQMPLSADRISDITVHFHGDSLLKKAFVNADRPELLTELNSLINNAIIAEGAPSCDVETHRSILERTYGYLNIALELLGGENEQKAVEILEHEPFTMLFRLGRSVVVPLRKTAANLHFNTDDFSYALNKALLGLKAVHPKFYRGLDPDMVDGYREFKSLEDVKKMETFLNDFVDRRLR